MPRPAVEQDAVLSGRLSVKDIYQNARYDAGYRMGWRDSHRMTRPAHRKTRQKYEEYATGYAHGFDGGANHPCPEWDDAHRTGPLRELPEGCPWRSTPAEPVQMRVSHGEQTCPACGTTEAAGAYCTRCGRRAA